MRTTVKGYQGSRPGEKVGTLAYKADCPIAAKKLAILCDAIQIDLDFWIPLMWAMRMGKATETEETAIGAIIERITPDYLELLRCP